jgi:radical SAM superfamily enzyme YgiQ (UPF0313 family)
LPMSERENNKSIALVTASHSLTLVPPLGLMVLAGVLRRKGYQVDIYDTTVGEELLDLFYNRVRSGKYLWIGISGLTPAFGLLKEIRNEIRKIDADLPIFLGGPHASSLPEQSLSELGVNAVCVGMGENAVLKLTTKVLARSKDYWSTPGVAAFDKEGKYRFDSELAKKNKQLPLVAPDWSGINLADYQSSPWQFVRRRRTIAPIITTRGCPFACSFCAVSSFCGRKLVHRQPGEVVDEIDYLVREHGAGEIQIVDDNFNVDLKYAKSVLRELVKRKLDIVWKTPNGIWIHAYDDEWFDLLKASGCYQVGFGIESGSEEVLGKVGKPIKLAEVPAIIEKYRSHGISTFGFFIIGLPGETEETLAQTTRFACSLKLDHIHVSMFAPYPGSKIYRQLSDEGRMSNDWDNYFHYSGFQVGELEVDRLKRAMRLMYLRFYARPSRAFGLMNDVRISGIRQFANLVGHNFLGLSK